MEPGTAPPPEAAEAPPQPPPRWWAPRRSWPLALGAAAAAALAAVALRAPALEGAVTAAALLLLHGASAALALRAARRLGGRLGNGWRLLGWASALAFLAVAALAGLEAAGRIGSAGRALVPLLGALDAFALVGLLLLAPPDMRPRSQARVALDGLIAAASLLFLVLAAIEGRRAGGLGLADLAAPAVGAAALAVALLVVAHAKGAVPAWTRLAAAAAGVAFAADVALAAGAPRWPAASAVLLALGLLGCAARNAQAWPQRAPRREPFLAQGAVYVPFGLAVAGSGASYLAQGGLSPALFFLLLGIVGLAVARTVMLLGENRSLDARLVESDAFKTQLLRFISHEIANPLSPLKVQARLLREGRSADPDRAWAAVDRSIGRLESLSRDVRLMALAETHRLVQTPQVADLRPRIAAAVQTYQPVAQQRGVRLRSEIPEYALAVPVDGERFDQVVDNLLSNALKFTPQGGSVDVRLWRAPGGAAVLEVKDSGAGMTPEQQAKLFTAFGRAHGSTQPGLGLGLYLCKAIVEGHEGRIAASSDGPGQGARFRVELPPQQAGGRGWRPSPRPAYPGGAAP